MSSIMLFRTRAGRLDAGKLQKISKHLGMSGKAQETDDALLSVNEHESLVYAQPCARLAGVLFYTDQAQSLAAPVKRAVTEARALAWGDGFLRSFDLLPKPPGDKRITLEIAGEAKRSDGIVFDGKQRKPVAIKTDYRTRTTLNGIPVVGPRAKARMIFKESERPAFVHVGFWDGIEIHEERELVREHDIMRTVREAIATRGKCGDDPGYKLVDIRLAYFAAEFRGGPDLLCPSYFVEIEQVHDDAKAQRGVQGPRQMLRFPAYR